MSKLKFPKFDEKTAKDLCEKHGLTIFVDQDDGFDTEGDIANPEAIAAMDLQHSLDRAHFNTTVDALMEVIEGLEIALKMYASLRGKMYEPLTGGAIHWPSNDRYSYLQIPALEALADAELRMRELGER